MSKKGLQVGRACLGRPLHAKYEISLSEEGYLEDNFGIFGGYLGDVRGICMDILGIS